MKKLTVPLVVLLALAFIITGCSTASPTPQATTSAPPTTAAATSAAPSTTAATAPATTASTSSTSAPPPTSAAATSATPASTLTPQYGGTLIFLSSMAPGTAIGWPAQAFFLSQSDVTPAIESLVQVDCKGNLSPELATAWQVAPDRKSITITLRQGVKYQDGTDFNAASAKWDMDEYMQAQREPLWASVDVIDNYTIRLNLTRWENTALESLGADIYVSPAAYQQHGVDWMKNNIVGTGGFKEVSYTPNVSLVFKKWDGYWQKGLPYLDGITFQYIADKTVMTAAFESGQGDTMRMGNLQDVAQLRDQGMQVLTALTVGAPQAPEALMPDSKDPNSPFAKLQVREAVEYAIDKAAITKARGFGFWDPAYQIANPAINAYDSSLPNRTYDVAKAKQLLADAGYPNGFKTTLTPQPGLIDQDSAMAVANYLGAIGITVQVQNTTNAQFTNMQQNGWNGLLMVGIGFGPNFAGDFVEYNFSKYSLTCASLAVPDSVNNALDTALQTLQPEAADEQALNDALYNDETVIPLWYEYEGSPVQPWVHNNGQESLLNFLSMTPEICWISPH